ncbi:PIN domain-like [Trinorchestia longiramus]|nr:PIN domain-like [Trinorchestia longiramus]
MGIKGLPEFINEYAKEAIIPHKLSGCRVIIDGKNLMYHLHSKCSRNTAAFGGDYDVFAAEVDKFFNSLLKCNIESCVLLDGGVSMKLSAVKWGVHLLKSGIKACAQAEPGRPAPANVYPPLVREVFISRVRSHGITVLQSDTSADDDIVTLASSFQLPVLSRDSDFCVHGLSVIDLNKLVYSKPVSDEDDPGCFYLRCHVFDKLKFCEIMDINPDHIMLLATLGMRPSLTRFKLVQFIKKISKGVKRDRSKPWSVYKMTVVQLWLSQRKDKSTYQLVEKVLDMLPKYREMRYTLRTILYRVLMITPTASPLLPWFTNGPDDWPCGHAAFTSGCQMNTDNLTTPDLINKVKAKKERYAARHVAPSSFLVELRRQDVHCPHAVTNMTFAGGLPLPRWFIISQRLCLLDFDAGEVFAKKTLFSMPMIESVSRESAALVALPVILVLLAMSEKTFFEYEKNYLMEQLKSLQDTPGEESAQLAETIRGNLKERKLNYYTFKKHLWKLRRACGKEAAAGTVAPAGHVVSSSSCEPKIDKSPEHNRLSEEEDIPRESLPSGYGTEDIRCLESDFTRMSFGSDAPDITNLQKLAVLPAPSMSTSGELNGSCILSNVNPLAENISNKSGVCSSATVHAPSLCNADLISEANVLEKNLDGNKVDDVVTLCDDADVISKSLLATIDDSESDDGSFHSCIDEDICSDSFQITLDEVCCTPETQEIGEDNSSCSEIAQDFDFSYFQSNLQNVPLSELMEPEYFPDLEESCNTAFPFQQDEFSAVSSQSNERTEPVLNDDFVYSDSDDDDVLIEDDDDPSILYKPSHLDIQTDWTASTELLHSTDSLQLQICANEHKFDLNNSFHTQNTHAAEISCSLEKLASVQNHTSFPSADHSKNDYNLENALSSSEETQIDPQCSTLVVSHFSEDKETCILGESSSIQHLNSSSGVQEDVNLTSSNDVCQSYSSVKNSMTKKLETTSANTDVQGRNLLGGPEFLVEYNHKGDYELKLLRKFNPVTETTLRNHFEVTLKKYRRHTEKVELYKKENKLIDIYIDKILEKMNTFLQKRMLPVLEKESNTNLAIELEKPLDGDYEKALLYTSHATSELLPYAMRPLSFFVRRSTMKSVKVVHLQNERTLQVPSLLTLHLKSTTERKELLCDFMKLEFKNLMRVPSEIQVVILSVCYWYENSRQKVTYYHLYAVLVSFVMFFFIDQKLGRIRWDEKLKEIVNLESKTTRKSSKLIASVKDTLKNISYIASHLDGHSCAVAALGLVHYHKPGPTVNKGTFQRHFVHTLSEFQCCYSFIGSLNSFLGSPFMMPSIDRVLNCTFAYNVFCDLSSCKDPGVSLAERLGPKKQMTYLMDALHSCVSNIVLVPKVLNMFPKEVEALNSKGKKVSKLVNDVDMTRKLRKEQGRIKELHELAKIDAIVKEIENMDVKKANENNSKDSSHGKQAKNSPKQSLNKSKKTMKQGKT